MSEHIQLPSTFVVTQKIPGDRPLTFFFRTNGVPEQGPDQPPTRFCFMASN